jgi:hypothetical protein
MTLYDTMKKIGKNTILAGSLTSLLIGCGGEPKILKHEDLTGDKIDDLIVKSGHGFGTGHGTWLYIGQEDGSFVTAKANDQENPEYFTTEDGTNYFFDGEFYKPGINPFERE